MRRPCRCFYSLLFASAFYFLMLPSSLEAAIPITKPSPRGGIYAVARTVILTADNPSATIYYTTDGSMPTTASFNGTSPVTINIGSTTVLKFFAKYGTEQESVKMERYVIAPGGITVATGDNHTLVLKANGALWAWGDNVYGELGLGDIIKRTRPTRIGVETSWKAIAVGGAFNLALKADGTLWAWGVNSYGQLGLGDTTQRNSPTQVGTETSWVAVAAGYVFSFALKTDGTLWAWGANYYGQLGLGDTTQRNSPTKVGTDATWTALAIGDYHNLALKADGTLWAWGYNNYYELGLGPDISNRNIPTKVGVDTNWMAVAAGGFHSLALKADGTLWAWGYNNYGQLGLGDYTIRNTPTKVGTETTWVALATGGSDHNLALKADGSLWAWGYNAYGELGLGDIANRNAPTRLDTGSNWAVLEVGLAHSFALKADGSLWAWGSNANSRLGLGDARNRSIPTWVGIGPWIAITAGSDHILALKGDGTLWAWGGNTNGQLGLGDTAQRTSPTQIGSGASWVAVAAGQYHNLAIRADGTLWAWGRNGEAQLGLGDTTQRNSPIQVGIGNTWVALAAGGYHSLAVRADGTLWAWGSNGNGQLGMGDTTQRTSPTQVGTGATWAAAAAGAYHSIALKSDGTLWSWGYNLYGQLGLGDTVTQRNSPTQVGTGATWVTAEAGSSHSLALKSDGTLWTWGFNGRGQLGLGDITLRSSPTQVGSDTTWVNAAVGVYDTVAFKADGTLWSWGYNNYGQLGLGDTAQRGTPTQVGSGVAWVEVAAGYNHNLALKSDGTLWTWGYNNYGQLGNGTIIASNSPILVDIYPPTNPSILINGGISYTNSLIAILTLSADDTTGVSQMCISTATTCTNWITYAPSTSWTLDAGNGQKTLYVWFKDRFGYVSTMASASTTLDMTLPQGGFSVNSGAAYTVSQNATLNLSATDNYGVAAYFASENSTLPSEPNWTSVTPTTSYSGNAAFSLGTGDGQKTIYVWFKDVAGNVSARISNQIILDTGPPSSGISISINDPGGNPLTATNTQTVTLTLAAPDTGTGTIQMGIGNSNDGVTDDGVIYEWRAFAPTTTWNLSNSTGPKKIYVKFRDVAGFVSTPVSYNITFDQEAPIVAITAPNDNTVIHPFSSISGTAGDNTGLSKIDLQVKIKDQSLYLDTTTNQWVAGDSERFFTPSAGSLTSWTHNTISVPWADRTTYTITARARDLAGNTNSTLKDVTYYNSRTYTKLSMDLSSHSILYNDTLVVQGRIELLPATPIPLDGLPITLTITPLPPLTGNPVTVSVNTYSTDGFYKFEGNFYNFSQEGTYALQANFVGAPHLYGATSPSSSVIVGAKAGYAVIIQGKVSNDPDGVLSHNKTANRIYQALLKRNFLPEDIRYYNYDTAQMGVYAVPAKTDNPSTLKQGIANAIQVWARDQLIASPAPLYIIMVDHGFVDSFYLDDQTITPTEMNLWLGQLETSLAGYPTALAKIRVVMIGACYSGSFIKDLSKTGRIIVTSAAENEQSFKGPWEPDTIRSGEYFLEELFAMLGRGYSLKKSFAEANDKTAKYTREGDNVNSVNRYFNNALQHPLLDDNADGVGVNGFSGNTGDGQVAENLYLGTGQTLTNSADNPAEVVKTTETLYLDASPSQPIPSLWLTTNDKESSAWLMIRPPGTTLTKTGDNRQLIIGLTPLDMTQVSGSVPHLWGRDGSFTNFGKYEIFYFVIDSETHLLSPIKRSVVYRRSGDSPPSSFSLMSPPSPGNGSETPTVLVLGWSPSTDPDGLTYTLLISKDSETNPDGTLKNIFYRKEEITTTMTYLDKSAGLEDKSTYYWQVVAVDGYGSIRVSDIWSFMTNNKNDYPGIITGIVYSDVTFARIAGATVAANLNGIVMQTTSTSDGSYILTQNQGSNVTLAALSVTGYQDTASALVPVTAGETTVVNLRMSPEAKPGDMDGSGLADLADAVIGLKILSGMPIPAGITLHPESDVNKDGKIGLADVIYILQKVAGIRQ